MSLLLFFLQSMAFANDEKSRAIEELYNRQYGFEKSGMMDQQTLHYLPAGDPTRGRIVSHQDTLNENHDHIRKVLSDAHKNSELKECDIGLIAYYFINTKDYQKLVKNDERIVRINNHYHIFFNEADSDPTELIKSEYSTIISERCK